MMKTAKLVRTLAAGLGLSGLVVGSALALLPAVSMGTIKLDGGTEKLPVSTAAITFAEGELVGKVVNKTGLTMYGLTIEVLKVGDDHKAPTGGVTKVSRPDTDARVRNSAAGRANDSGTGTTTNVLLETNALSETNVGKALDGDTLLFQTTVQSTDGDEVTVHFTASTMNMLPVATAYADVLSLYGLSAGEPSKTDSLDIPFNDRAAMRVTNMDRTEKLLKGISGSVDFGANSSSSLHSVHLSGAGSMRVPAGTHIAIEGNTFSITSFQELSPTSSYDLVLVFDKRPASSYKVKLTGQF